MNYSTTTAPVVLFSQRGRFAVLPVPGF